MYWWGLQENYIHDLDSHKNITVFTNPKSALYYLGFNLRKKPFKNVYFRKAVALSVDKPFIIKRIIQGYAVLSNAIIPPGNTFWYDPDVPTYGEGFSREKRIRSRLQAVARIGIHLDAPSRQLRWERWSKAKGSGTPMEHPMETITILTPLAEYDPKRAMVGNMVQQWLTMLGIPVVAQDPPPGISPEKGQGCNMILTALYWATETFPWIRTICAISSSPETTKPNGWNTSGYHNPQFDQIADASADALGPGKKTATHTGRCRKLSPMTCPGSPFTAPKWWKAPATTALRVGFQCWGVSATGGLSAA